MKLSYLAIKNYQFTIVIICLLSLIGLVSLITMPKIEDPQVSKPADAIVVLYPGATPSDIEQIIINPLEELFNELEDVDVIRSNSYDGVGVVNIIFTSDQDPDLKYKDVVEKVNMAKNTLPKDVVSIEILKYTILDVNILQFALVGDSIEFSELDRKAKELKKEIEKSEGVRKVDVLGSPKQEICITIDFERLAQINIPLFQVIGAIQSNNNNLPAGNIKIGEKEFNVVTSGSYKDIEDLKNTIVHGAHAKVIRLSEIADVQFAYEDNLHLTRLNGEKALFITVQQKAGFNIYDVVGGIKPIVQQFQSELPRGLNLDYVFDQSKEVSFSLNNFLKNFLQGILVVGLCILIAVGFRPAVIVILAIPISILIGIGWLDISGFALEQVSIGGLVIALGLLVDNSIAVIENIVRFIEMGYSPKDAAIKGTSQIGWALVSSTVTTILAFVPMIMLSGETGEFIRSLPTTVVLTLIASLIIALGFTPLLASKILKSEVEQNKNSIDHLGYVKRFIRYKYPVLLRKVLDRPKTSLLITIVGFGFTVFLAQFVGVSFFPKSERPQLLINVNSAIGSNIEKTSVAVKFVESELEKYDYVNQYASNIGGDNPVIYYNSIRSTPSHEKGQVFVTVDQFNVKEMTRLVSELRETFNSYSGAKIEVKELIQGPPVEAPIAIKLIGNNLDDVAKVSVDIENFIAQNDGVVNVNNPSKRIKTALHVNIDKEKAGLYGIKISDIDLMIRAAITGLHISSFRDDKGDEYDIIIKMPYEDSLTIENFQKIYIPSIGGKQIPLSQIADIEFKSGPVTIDHYNLDRNITITADVSGAHSVFEITKKIIKKLEAYDWPKGIRYHIAGEQEKREESFGGMGIALIIALIGIFAVLVLQFESYTQPLIIFSAIPLALIGSILALLITGYSFSFTAFVGLTSLIGIVVNDSILLVDYANQLRKKGMNILEAIIEAGKVRFVPIILTSITTIGGLLPLTLQGGDLWAPMGWTIIGGMVTSTFLTLIVVPVLYILYSREP